MQPNPAFPGAPDPFVRWTPPDFSDLAGVARALEETCPDAMPVGPLQVLGEGFFSVAVATASGMVFRLGTAPDVFARYQKEWRVLPWLARQALPLAVPAPRWLVAPSPAFPFGGIGYPLVEGRTLTEADIAGPHRARFAQQIAAFNLAVHRLPIEDARTLGVPDGRASARAWHETDRAVGRVALAPVLTAPELAAIEVWWDRFLDAFDARTYTPVFVHTDIGDENLLVDPSGSSLIGVIDFEHCAVGDPFDDFDGLEYLGRDFYRETIEAYARLGGPSLAHLDGYLDLRWQRGAFPGLRRAWQRGDPIEGGAIRSRFRRYRVPLSP